MRLAVRLWLLGAGVPFVATLVCVALAGQLFRATQERELDASILEQAAVESVSLFDGAESEPHLHLEASPLRDQVAPIAPSVALYGRDGALRLAYPTAGRAGWTAPRLRPSETGATPRFETVRLADGGRVRRVSAMIPGPNGAIHAIQVADSFAEVDASVARFHRWGLLLALTLGAGLFALQTLLARRLRARVTALTGHMAALREGNLEAVPPFDPGQDELADLSRVVAEATERLRLARAAQDRLVADAAHELRTPLTLMRTSIDLALRRRREVPELVASLEETRREVDRLARLATRLLDLATAGRGEWDRTPGDLTAVAEDAAEAARAAAEQRSVLVQVCAPGPVPATFDAAGIRQAVDNLLSNAIRYSPPGTTIQVEVAAADGLARVTVQDFGPGIPPQERERLFQPFERGDRMSSGAGLGLALVREIARGHGGRAYVADAPRGARVVLEVAAGALREQRTA